MRIAHIAAGLLLMGLLVPLEAQRGGQTGPGRQGSQGIPPGQMPSAGQCRVWYDNLPPGRQASPTSCREAERIASRDRNARVIYGSGTYEGYGGYGGSQYPRATPRPDNSRYPGRSPNTRYAYQTVAFDNGYRDGVEKGREDARDDDSYDPVRHSRYRSGDHGYSSRYGAKDDYKLVYRDGFESGYNVGYRDAARSNRRQESSSRWPWPF